MLAIALITILAACAGSGPAVIVTVDNSFHNPGDTATIRVCACYIPKNYSNDVFSVYVDGPDGRNQLHKSFRFNQLPATIAWKISENAIEGTYTITVTWDHHYIQTGIIVTAQTIPEFPFTSLVLLVALATATGTMARRKTSARSTTLAFHS